MTNRRSVLRTVLGAAVTGGAATLAMPAGAQGFPARPVKILVGFAPGGPTDAVARLFAERLTPRLGQPVLIENLSGAGGDVATLQMLR
ncbi:MAG TPA: hypothetical protein VE684_17175 [Crenalkalicoccus sp.]|nr:hypothetical protein [Crenalkalicoccus sp.]